MNYTNEEVHKVARDVTKDTWQQVLDAVEEVAPEDAEIIKRHADVCLRLYHQGVYFGWTNGVNYLAKDLIARDEAALKAEVKTLQ